MRERRNNTFHFLCSFYKNIESLSYVISLLLVLVTWDMVKFLVVSIAYDVWPSSLFGKFRIEIWYGIPMMLKFPILFFYEAANSHLSHNLTKNMFGTLWHSSNLLIKFITRAWMERLGLENELDMYAIPA